MRAPRTTWLLVTITPRRSITTPEASPLLPLNPTVFTLTTPGSTRATMSAVLAAAGARRRRGGGRRRPRHRHDRGRRVVRAVAAPGGDEADAASGDERRPSRQALIPESESAPAASASSAARPTQREAQLAPLVLVPEPGGEVLVDRIEARLALGREELATRGLRDLPQRHGIGRHGPREAAAVEHAVRRAQRDRVDRDAVRLRARGARPAGRGSRASGRRPRAAGSPTAAGSGSGGARRSPPLPPTAVATADDRLQQLDRAGQCVPDGSSLAERRRRAASPSSTSCRSCVSGAATYGSEENVTSPTRYCVGKLCRGTAGSPPAPHRAASA